MTSVRDRGAKGDGVTDDTTAVQSALAVGGVVTFPAGVYSVRTLFISSNTTLTGEPGATLSLRAGTDGCLLRAAGSVTNVRIERLAIDGNRQNNPSSSYTIILNAPTAASLTDLTIANAAGDAITLSNAVTNCAISRVTSDGLIRADRDTLVTSCRVVGALDWGISVGSDCTVRDCSVDQSAVAANGIHVQMNATNAKVVSNKAVVRTDQVGSSAIGTSAGASRCLIEGNTTIGGDAGIAVYGSDNRIIGNHVSAAGYISPTTGDGIIVNTGPGNVVSGNAVTGTFSGPGIEVQAPDTIVVGNAVTDVRGPGIGTWFPRTVITGNIVTRAGAGNVGNDASGVNVNGDDVLVANNIARGCGNASALTSSGVMVGSGANAMLVGNRCTGQQYGLLQAGGSTAVVAEGNHLVANTIAATRGSFVGTAQIA